MRKLFLLMISVIMCSVGLMAQTATYHGTVLDAVNDEPLIGATIMPIGGGQGVAADIDGNFVLTVPSNVKKAKITYVGYTEQTVDLKNNMVVHLASASTSLDDLVVVAYGTATKESLTGSVAVIGSKDIEDRPVTSVTSALEGNAPGIQVNNTVGVPGTDPQIRIRGFNSINGKNDPLYVVDGVPYHGSIADLNPADIESMSVLKDAASAALYGNKGANGVILITTKKAKSVGKVDVTLQIRQGIYTRGIPEYDRLSASEWMQVAYDSQVNGGVLSGAYPNLAQARAYYNQNFINSYANVNIFGVPDNELFNAKGQFVGGEPLPGYTDLNWWDAVRVKSGHRQEYNVNAAAATEKFNVFASVGYLKEHGYTVSTDFERFSGRLNANYNPVSYLKLGVNLSAAQQEQAIIGYESNSVTNPFNTMSMAPIYPYYQHDADGNIMYDENGQPIWNIVGYMQNDNVGFSSRANKSHGSSTLFDGSIYATAVIPYGFELTVRGTMHRDKNHSYEYTNNEIGSGIAYNGILANGYADYRNHTFLQELTWNQDYGLHHVDVLLHHENTTVYSEGSSYQLSNQQFANNLNASNFSAFNYASGGITEVHDESYLGRARYNYNQKYFGEFSLRRDGTSRFAKNNRWGTFWSVGASWVISKEKFMQDLLWLNYLKLRAAYGSVGNCISANEYAYWALYAPFVTYDGVYTITPAQLAASNVRWEATKTLDVALEGSLFNDRFGFSIGYFNKHNSDLLFNQVLSASQGTIGNTGANPSVLTNVGTMQNIGWELAFNGDIIRTRDLVWSLSLDATFMKNKVLKLPGHQNVNNGINLLTEGKSVYELYLYPWAGVDQLTGKSLYEIDKSSPEFQSYNATTQTYAFNESLYNTQIEAARADGALVEHNGKLYTTKTTYAGRVLCGSAIPVVSGSFGTQFSWKGINLSALFTYSLGGKLVDSNYATLMSYSDQPSAIHVDALNAWKEIPAGMTADSPNRIDPNGVPQANTYWSQFSTVSTSTRFMTSADYLVFKNLNISYDLPQKWVNAIKLQNINIGVSMDNLFTATKRKGLNPQQSFNGSQGNYYVTPRVFSFQLSARF